MKKVVVLGGGPSGLFFSLLLKQRFPKVDIEVYEQNPENATYGFGINLAQGGHGAFRNADPEVADAISEASLRTCGQRFSLNDQEVMIEGGPWGGAIARIELIRVLLDFCRMRGVTVYHDARVENPDRFDADLIVGADGVNSVLRQAYEGEFGTRRQALKNRLAWYGTSQHYPEPILSFKTTEKGNFWAVAYPHSGDAGTFVAECDAEAWRKSGLNRMSMEERMTFSEQMFERELAGASLLSNRSDWISIPVITNSRWFVGNRVLIGDALRNAHPSIGSGTRIAMEDAIALCDALVANPDDVNMALEDFQRCHASQSDKLVQAMRRSVDWYESVGPKLQNLDVVDLAFDYMTRTGRISEARLQRDFPRFMQKYQQRWRTWLTSADGSQNPSSKVS